MLTINWFCRPCDRYYQFQIPCREMVLKEQLATVVEHQNTDTHYQNHVKWAKKKASKGQIWWQ